MQRAATVNGFIAVLSAGDRKNLRKLSFKNIITCCFRCKTNQDKIGQRQGAVCSGFAYFLRLNVFCFSN